MIHPDTASLFRVMLALRKNSASAWGATHESIAMGQAFRIEHYVNFPTVEAAEMAALVRQFGPASEADALRLLRVNFAGSSLSMRLAALDMLMRRGRHRSETGVVARR